MTAPRRPRQPLGIPELARSLPFAHKVPGTWPSGYERLVEWLELYAVHAKAEADRLAADASEGRRAVTVLRSLSSALKNIVSVLAAADHAEGGGDGG